MFWTLFFTISLSLVPAPSPRAQPDLPYGVGCVQGRSAARYSLTLPPGAPVLPEFSNNGYRQSVQRDGDREIVTVRVDLEPLRLRLPFSPDWTAPVFTEMPRPFLKGLKRQVAGSQRMQEAVNAVLLYLKSHVRYVQRPRFEETARQVCRRGEASCVGLTDLCSKIFNAWGLKCQTVIGLRFPESVHSLVLAGGVLHAWLELDCGKDRRFFCDPWFSAGWVPASYIVLRVGGGLGPGALARDRGGRVRLLARKDRIFYEPGEAVRSVIWERPNVNAFTGNLLTGKVLKDMDTPARGRAVLASGNAEVSQDLWRGNFFFRDLTPGAYTLKIQVSGRELRRYNIQMSIMDRKQLVIYANTLHQDGSPDGTGR